MPNWVGCPSMPMGARGARGARGAKSAKGAIRDTHRFGMQDSRLVIQDSQAQ